MSTSIGTRVTTTGRGGPPLLLPITAYVVIAVAGALTFVGGSTGGADPSAVLAAVRGDPSLARVSAVLLIASAAPLAVWTAAAVHRLHELGARVAGAQIALVGGVLAAGALALSGVTAWVAAGAAELGDAGLVWSSSTTSFVLGGVGFALASALLLAGIAVPALLARLVPRPLAIAGVVLAACGAVAVLGLLTPALFPLLPITRFGGMLWLVAVSVALPRPGRPGGAAA